MKNKIIIGIAVIVTIIIVVSAIESMKKPSEFTVKVTPFNIDHKGKGRALLAEGDNIFEVWVYEDEMTSEAEGGAKVFDHQYFGLKPENSEIYDELGILNDPQKTIFVVPIFTITAYGDGGFYEFYNGKCDEKCIKEIPIRHDLPPNYQSSDNSIKVLRLFGYPFITDIEIEKNPDILKKFDKVIMLHSEYVTKNEFDAVTKHPKVIYLHPNALFAEVEYSQENDTLTLIKGHGYPRSEIKNGFEWKYDNTYPYEFDNTCEGWKFYEIYNGIMLNCYPEKIIYTDNKLLKTIKEY
jgi:hypothetical protein